MDELIKRIKEKCTGRERWYVMNAAEDGYCMDFDWQLDADRWMADRLRENPDYIKRNGYHIVKRQSLTAAEDLANEAATALEAANAQNNVLDRLCEERFNEIASLHARIAALEAQIAAAEKQEPVAYFHDTSAIGEPAHYEQVAKQFYGAPGTIALYLAAPLPSVGKDAERWRELKQHTHETEQRRGCTASEYGQANWLLNYATMDEFMDGCIEDRKRAALAKQQAQGE